ncbi:extracellular solute-binding protein [Auraticoccus sp. F435]|uniref:Extracellular solute-binding protein n=1 Tax=Auraticoccus cholistanensis TaxID=2656650 RepID=A0A6A9UPJ9_9ACTN|nr:extracellular solute-binding protein [Auraticoccus cholistanensis]MVA74468.1 extracellular solute-binding protein [Auraticoccus cholistanensis]
MNAVSRRKLFQLSALVGGGLAGSSALSACGGVGGGGDSAGALRYAMWGNNVRQQNYSKAFEEMQAAVPDLQIAMEFADYTAFQERMTTQMAARNVPHVFWVPSPQVMTYYANDLYRDLEGIETLDLSDYSPTDLDGFKLDGKLNTMPFGIFVPVLRYNTTFAEEDGVELPEDGAGWTWDSLAELAKDYSANSSQGRKALSYGAEHDLSFENWLRQRGEQLWTEDGRVGFTQDGLASWIEWWEDLRKAGATTSISEQDGVAPDWPTVGDKILMNFGNSNHIIDDAQQFPDYDFALRHPPVAEDAPEGFQYLYYPRMAVYSGAEDDMVAKAGQVLTYCTSTVEMLKTVGLTMGAPVNPRVAEEIAPSATADEQEMLRIVAEDRAVERKPRYEAPPGSSTWRTVMGRVLEEVTLGSSSISEAASSMIDEVTTAIERAA